MDAAPEETAVDRLRAALTATASSARLQAALSAGTYPDASYVDALVERCAIEPDFYVRDMLTWALTRLPAEVTVPRLIAETKSEIAQARSQALHSLSKVGDPAGWAAITDELLRDPDDSVARPAWRAAVLLVPADGRQLLAAKLATQLGRGDRDVQLSLSRALATLEDAAADALAEAAAGSGSGESGGSGAGALGVRIHAIATARMIDDPDEGFDSAIFEAERIVVFGGP
jgi:HEAT repeat protein